MFNTSLSTRIKLDFILALSTTFTFLKPTTVMGIWGFGFFESESQLDHASDIEHQIGVFIFHPKHPDKARRILDSGILTDAFEHYIAANPFSSWDLIYLAVMAMMLGAKIEPKYINIVRGIYLRTNLFEQQKLEFKHGLDSYKNDGTPWNPESTRMTEQPQNVDQDYLDFLALENVGGPGMLDVPFKKNNPLDLTGKEKCWSCTKGTEGLIHCEKCHKATYCNARCAKKDKSIHSKYCVASDQESSSSDKMQE